MKKVGYARVSTEDQKLELQTDALKLSGCIEIYTEKASGSRTDRPKLIEALKSLDEGDCLVVWKLDRLGRSVKHFIDIADELSKRKINLLSLSDGIDTSTSMGRFFFVLMSAFSEMERELNSERTKAGLRAAKERGRHGGRPLRMTPSKLEAVEALIINGTPVKDISTALEISIPTIYRFFPVKSYRTESEKA